MRIDKGISNRINCNSMVTSVWFYDIRELDKICMHFEFYEVPSEERIQISDHFLRVAAAWRRLRI